MMMMLPVCSATTSCSSHSQIIFPEGLQPSFGYRKVFKTRYLVNCNLLNSNGSQLSVKPLLVKATRGDIVISTNEWSSSMKTINYINPTDESYMASIGDLAASSADGGSTELLGGLTENAGLMPGYEEAGYVSHLDAVSVNTTLLPDSETIASDSLSGFATNLDSVTSLISEQVDKQTVVLPDSVSVGSDSLSGLRLNAEEITSGVNLSINTNSGGVESNITSSVDAVTSSFQGGITKAKDAISHIVSQLTSSIDQTEELAGRRLDSIWGEFKQATGRAGAVSIDVFRRAIVTFENSLSSGASLISYTYGSAKELLPSEVRDVLNVTEETASKILVPVGSALEKASVFIVGLERQVGLDPDDPIVSFVIFFGTSATLWYALLFCSLYSLFIFSKTETHTCLLVKESHCRSDICRIFYQRQIYGGYAGDLSPKETLELLTGRENAVLIDVRPEELRERDGIPDLRRGARFRYANVNLLEFDSSAKKLLKSGRELDDALIAVVIKNLKIVQDKSKVVIMDADGSRSKGIARTLRKLGIKESYLMEGGFRNWVKEGLRIKELKPETTLTILNEEAEAILEEINPTPIQIIGSGLGLLAASYAILEWEKTLQLIGLFGIGLTIYSRVSSYNDSEDLKKDVRLLLAPVKMGAAALSWASGKLETNGNGLPTSPSSLDVQNRVLKAVAKHESQPSEPEGVQAEPSSDSASPVTQPEL